MEELGWLVEGMNLLYCTRKENDCQHVKRKDAHKAYSTQKDEVGIGVNRYQLHANVNMKRVREIFSCLTSTLVCI